MARRLNRLSARAVETISQPGRHADGAGLYLVIGEDGSRRWVFIWRRGEKRREMGLGPANVVALKRARELAALARQAVADDRDPIAERRAKRAETATPTFGAIAEEVLANVAAEAKNDKHAAQWRMTLTEYAKPLWSRRVDQIETRDVLEVLKPHWQERPETASRLRGRVEKVLDAAKAKGHRTGENPARWKGNLDHLLPKRDKAAARHHAALPYDQVRAFLHNLRARETVGALAFEFTILTAARTGEVIAATWEEIDLAAGLWTIPGHRMKAGRPHRVPLCGRSLEIARYMHERRISGFVFPGQRSQRPLSNMVFEQTLRRMGRDDITAHGFRSAFRDWCGDATTFPREVAEAALAHIVGDKAEQAYRRGDALEKRRALMEQWDRFCMDEAGAVIPMRRA